MSLYRVCNVSWLLQNDLHVTRLYGQYVNATWADCSKTTYTWPDCMVSTWTQRELTAPKQLTRDQTVWSTRARNVSWLLQNNLHVTRLYGQYVNATWADCSKTTYTWPDCMVNPCTQRKLIAPKRLTRGWTVWSTLERNVSCLLQNGLHATRLYGQHVNTTWAAFSRTTYTRPDCMVNTWTQRELIAPPTTYTRPDCMVKTWTPRKLIAPQTTYTRTDGMVNTWTQRELPSPERLTRDQTVWSTREHNVSWLLRKRLTRDQTVWSTREHNVSWLLRKWLTRDQTVWSTRERNIIRIARQMTYTRPDCMVNTWTQHNPDCSKTTYTRPDCMVNRGTQFDLIAPKRLTRDQAV